MQPPEAATTVRVQDGKTLTTDGPFVSVKEALGGYFFFEADDLGTGVTLSGVGFTDVTTVKFNGVAAAFTILSPTSIRATVPAGATTGKVSATSPQGTVGGPRFTVRA